MAEYDPQHTMLALNMAIVSVNRILTSHDKAVLEWEYRNIINRLALGNIADDPEMKKIYSELMGFITGRGLRDEEMKRLQASYTRREQEVWYRAMAEGTRSRGGLWNFLSNMSRKLERKIFGQGFMMSYYGNEYRHEAEKQKLSGEIETATWQLTKADIEACNTLCTDLLTSSWTLLRRYGLGDEYRLTSESLQALTLAVNEEDLSTRLDMLNFIEPLFSVYPPYWYLCAETAYNAGNEAECREYMDKFDEVWRPVLKYDPCKLEATKYRIRELAKSGKVSGYDAIEEVRRLLEVVRKYTAPGDWDSVLFAGMVYFVLGDREKGKSLLRANVNFGYEKEISGAVLAQLEAGSFETAKLASGLHWLFESELDSLTADELKQLAEYGNADAQYRLGLMYSNGYGVPQDKAEAVKWYRKSAEQGYALAQNNLGFMYYNGEGGLRQDKAEAVKWYRKSAEQGCALAQNNLGLMYDNGYGVPQDKAEAVKWYRKAAEQGYAEAQFNLGFMYDNGEGGLRQDKAEAVKWYRKSAEQGYALAQNNLGFMYEYGEGGLRQDKAEAVRLYRLSAEQGCAPAQNNLGAMYEYGEGGLKQDYTEAVRLYRLSAEQGNAFGQFSLGDMYEYGKGVPKDLNEARKWYQKAADQGHERAKEALKRLR